MMEKITWADIDGKIPLCTLGRLMDEVEKETGKFPDWNDEVPAWVGRIAPQKARQSS